MTTEWLVIKRVDGMLTYGLLLLWASTINIKLSVSDSYKLGSVLISQSSSSWNACNACHRTFNNNQSITHIFTAPYSLPLKPFSVNFTLIFSIHTYKTSNKCLLKIKSIFKQMKIHISPIHVVQTNLEDYVLLCPFL